MTRPTVLTCLFEPLSGIRTHISIDGAPSSWTRNQWRSTCCHYLGMCCTRPEALHMLSYTREPERVQRIAQMGVEPTMTAYETIVLPLHYRAISA